MAKHGNHDHISDEFLNFAARSAVLGSLSLLAGCASLDHASSIQKTVLDQAYGPHPEAGPMVAIMPEAIPKGPEIAPTRGSLWSPDTQISWFSDDKSLRRGDTVLVRVVQKTTGTKKADTSTQRDSSISAQIKYFLGLEKPINKLTDYKTPAVPPVVAAGVL